MWQDIRYGFRTLIQRPGFTLAAVVALGLGIGANTAIFGVVNGLMFRPLPVREAGELVSIVGRTSQAQFMHAMSYPDLRDYGGMTDVFAGVIAHGPNTARLTTEGVPERVLVTLASGNYFSVLKLDFDLGRGWQTEEGDPGGEPVIVLDHSYWQNRFGGDPSVVGSIVQLNGQPVTVIGVTPEAFPGTVGFIRSHAYAPFSTWGLLNPNFEKTLDNRDARFWRSVARLAPGVDRNEASAAVATMAAHLEEEYPESNKTLRAFVYPEPIARLEPAAISYLPPVVTVFMLLVSLVLLIACANAANLLLARASERRREMAVRASLGAGRLRILRQLVTESVLIAIAGGIAGLVLAYWAGNVLSSIRVASDIPLHFDFSIDYRVFGYAMLVALGAGLLAGLAPGIHAARTNLVDALKEGGRSGAGAGRHRIRSILVASQVAVSLVLLVCTALFVQSMRNISEVDPGFDYENRIMLSMDTSLLNYEEDRGETFYRDLIERIRNLPGVRNAATARFVHIGYNNGSRRVYLEGEGEGVEEEDDLHNAMYNLVSSDYFSTLGISLLDGRVITEQDDAASRPVAVINNTMAEELWPDQNPLGKRFSVEGPGGPFIEIIGVVETGFYLIPGEPPQPMYYRPLKQRFAPDQTLFVHTEPEPTSLVPTLRAEIRALDADMPIFDVYTLESHVKEGKAELLFNLPARLVGAFALIGAVLAGLGLYAVIAYSVTQRTHEIGLRVALGASSSSIVRLVILKGVVLGLFGIGLGILLTYGVTRTFANLLIGVSASDPTTYVAVSFAVLIVALAACFIPAQFRAARIDPVVALRDE
jgi:putative ABC transport system permease protein